MPVLARRAFRLGFTVALALACAYGLAMPLPYLAPMFAVMLTASPTPPMGPKQLVALLLLVALMLGVGMLLTPLLLHYPLPALLIVATGLFFSFYLTVNLGKGLAGTLLTVGITMISAAGTVSSALASAVISALIIGIGVAILCQWLVYPFFPETTQTTGAAESGATVTLPDGWIALRATLIVLPPYLLALTNPGLYLPLIMKSVSLALQGSEVSARSAGRELLGSTFVAGCLAALFWLALKLAPTLWMFFLWMLLFGSYVAAKHYGAISTRFTPSFWRNVLVTLLILLGPAVEDSATGSDVYARFVVRMSLFVAVTLYAWTAIELLEHLRSRRMRFTPGTAY